MYVVIYYPPWSAVITLFYMLLYAGSDACAYYLLYAYYMYVSTFVRLMPYVRSMMASLLVKMPLVLLYFIIYSYLHVCIFTLLS
jgi:hypothetical protein